MPCGEIDFVNDTDGYGFIEIDEVDKSIFVHREDLNGPDLKEGQKVEFTIEWVEKGPRAQKVKKLTLQDVQGKITFFNDTGGYGFIKTNAVEEDIFFHREDISESNPAEVAAVTVDVKWENKGPRVTDFVRGHEPSTPDGSTGSVPKSSDDGTVKKPNSKTTDTHTDTGTNIYEPEDG